MERCATVDITIVVRVWMEPHDDHPRARLAVVGEPEELTARGVDDIERALGSMIDRFVIRS